MTLPLAPSSIGLGLQVKQTAVSFTIKKAAPSRCRRVDGQIGHDG
jgi:hypothetical protein